MPGIIRKISGYAVFAAILLSFISPSKPAYSAERAPVIYAFYCPSEEIAFIGELMPPVLSTIENDKVRAELGLTDTQIKNMKEMENMFLSGIGSVLAHSENKERDRMGDSRRSRDNVIAIGKFSEDARKRTNDILKPRQLLRMQEILLQRYGLLSIPKKDLRQLMTLEAKQERAIDEIRSDIFRAINKTALPDSVVALPDGCKFVSVTNPDIGILLQESEKKARRLLSPEQNNILEKIKGKDFSF